MEPPGPTVPNDATVRAETTVSESSLLTEFILNPDATSWTAPTISRAATSFDLPRPRRRNRRQQTAIAWLAIGADWNEDEILAEFRDRPNFAWHDRVQDDIRLLQIAIPRHYRELVEDSIGLATNYTGVAPNYSPVEYYQALGAAIDALHLQSVVESPIERARRLRSLRAVDEQRSASASAPEAFSRECGVCFADAPDARAVLTACGHLMCAPCADTLADVRADEGGGGGGRLVCPYCRADTGFVVLVEEEEEAGSATETEASNDVVDNNCSTS